MSIFFDLLKKKYISGQYNNSGELSEATVEMCQNFVFNIVCCTDMAPIDRLLQAGPWTPEAAVEDPEAVRQLHREFLRAGSDVMQVELVVLYMFSHTYIPIFMLSSIYVQYFICKCGISMSVELYSLHI